jgi:2-haloacid dehalogenase
VLADSLAELAGEYGWGWNSGDGEALARSMESWQPFPDTVPALRAAREAGIGLGIISNCDRAIIEHAVREIDVPPDQILHVAFGFKYDIAPAQQLGQRTAWVNRHRIRRRATCARTTNGPICGRSPKWP